MGGSEKKKERASEGEKDILITTAARKLSHVRQKDC